MQFAKYAQIYDALNSQKDYENEIRNIKQVFESALNRKFEFDTAIEIGFGTGNFTKHLSKYADRIFGIEISQEMLEIAEAKSIANVEFYCQDYKEFKPEKRVDLIIALFHTVSYFNLAEFNKFLDYGYSNLNKGAVLIFDYWDSRSVTQAPPTESVRFAEFEGKSIKRYAYPKYIKNESKVEIRFEFVIQNADDGHREYFEEIHCMNVFQKIDILDAIKGKFDICAEFDMESGKPFSAKRYGNTFILLKK